MKTKLLIVFAAFSTVVIGQPVIPDGTNIPTVGYSAPISAASSSNVGGAGANQTWDFSNLFFLSLGTMNVISPSSSSMSSSFPTANLAYTFTGTSSFFKISPTKFEVQAYTITSPGTGNDYSPNSRTLLKFPFSYQEQFIDTCQIVGGTALQLTLTYDGYGTLLMPGGVTYTDVVRIKEDYGNGTVDYEWYTLNPLIILMQYRSSSSNLFFTDVDQITTSISEQNNATANVLIYPNPATEKVYVDLKDFKGVSQFTLCDMLGKKVKECSLTSDNKEIGLEDVESGVYFYTIQNNQNSSTGKLIIH